MHGCSFMFVRFLGQCNARSPVIHSNRYTRNEWNSFDITDIFIYTCFHCITHSCYLVSYDHRSSQFLFSAPRWSRWRCPLAVGNLRLRELELLMTFLITWSIFCGGQWWGGRGQGTGKRHTGWRGGGGFLSSYFHPPHSFYSSPLASAGSPWWLCPPHSSFLVTAPVPF